MKPILFSGPMVRAILEGKKTQTRRVIKKPEPWQFEVDDDGTPWVQDDHGGFHKAVDYSGFHVNGVLWVRETFCYVDDTEYGGEKWIDYRATPRYESSHPAGWENAPDDENALKWKPSIFMPKDACRLFLKVRSVNAERLWDITLAGVRAEGFSSYGEMSKLWDSLNKKRGYGWDKNPWVWVIEFEVDKTNSQIPAKITS